MQGSVSKPSAFSPLLFCNEYTTIVTDNTNYPIIILVNTKITMANMFCVAWHKCSASRQCQDIIKRSTCVNKQLKVL